MDKARLFWRYPSDGGTFLSRVDGASGDADGFPASNLQLPQLGRYWKGIQAHSGEYVELVVDLGASYTVSAAAVLSHNLLENDDSVYFQGHTSDSWGAPQLSEAVTWASGPLVSSFTPTTLRHWRFVWRASATRSYQLGRLVFGTHYDCPRGATASKLTRSWIDGAVRTRNASGQVYGSPGSAVRLLNLDFRAAPQAQLDEIEALYRTLGTGAPFLCQILPQTYGAADGWALYGSLEAPPSATFARYNGTPAWDLSLSLGEWL